MTDIEVPDFNRPRLSAERHHPVDRRTDARGPRFFPADDLSLCGEVYDRRKRAGVVVGTVSYVCAAGREVYRTPFAPDGLQSRHCARIPLKQLGAGAYSATVEAVSTSPSPASVYRTVAFSVGATKVAPYLD